MKIILLGADGQLGSAFRDRDKGQIIFYGRDLDILDYDRLHSEVSKQKPDIVISTIAYTQVDRAETDRESAYNVNVNGMRNLVKLQKELQFLFITFSTDFIYTPTLNTPIKEDDPIDPINYYGETKYLGERELDEIEKYINLRISWLYYEKGNNFVKTMLKLSNRGSLSVVSDQIGTPTYCGTVVDLVNDLIERYSGGELLEYGNFNLSDLGVASWYDFAEAIFEFANLECSVIPIRSDQYKTDAKRAHYSLMSKDKVIDRYAPKLKHWRAVLKESIGRFNG